ncbi:1189_t:CDS:2, partial [Funneliformis geosporum]
AISSLTYQQIQNITDYVNSVNVHRQVDRHEVVLHVPLPHHCQAGRYECDRQLQGEVTVKLTGMIISPCTSRQLAVRLTVASCVGKIQVRNR